MTSSDPGLPGDDVPAEDWAEQATEAEPPTDDAEEPAASALEVDEADLAEQQTTVYTGDDEER